MYCWVAGWGESCPAGLRAMHENLQRTWPLGYTWPPGSVLAPPRHGVRCKKRHGIYAKLDAIASESPPRLHDRKMAHSMGTTGRCELEQCTATTEQETIDALQLRRITLKPLNNVANHIELVHLHDLLQDTKWQLKTRDGGCRG